MLTWMRARMPLDGRGWEWPEGARRLLFEAASGSIRRRLPAPLSGPILVAARVGWFPLALSEAWTYARRPGRRTRLGPLFVDCLMAGAWPGEAQLWRDLFGERIELGKRALTLLLPKLGDPAGHALLADKVATACALLGAGAPAPQTLAIVQSGGEENDLQAVRQAGTGLVIKPRFGFGARGLLIAEPLAGDRWRVNGAEAGWDDFEARLRRARQPLLAQPRLRGARALDGFLGAERPPILRITTARRQGGAPFVHGALLSVPVPGAVADDFATKDIRAPVDLASGRLHAARLFAKPAEMLASVPWNGAAIEGRMLEGYADAAQATLAAAAAIPPLPVISWDVVLTDAGPMILEGNSVCNWVLVNYGRTCGADADSLVPLLAEWNTAADTIGRDGETG